MIFYFVVDCCFSSKMKYMGNEENFENNFITLQYASYSCCFVRARFVINAPFCYKSQKLPRFVITLAPFCYKPQKLPRFVITLAPFCYKKAAPFCYNPCPVL